MTPRFSATAGIWIWQIAGLLLALAAGGTGYVAAGWQGATAAVPAPGAATSAAAVRNNSNTANGTAAPIAKSDATPADAAAGGERSAARGSIDIERLWESSALAGAGVAGAAAAGPEAWRITGVFQTESGPSVIITFSGSTPPRYLRVSDKLPNGASIVAILPDSITVRTMINNRWVMVALDV